MASPKPFRADSYRKPYGVREQSDSGYGYGKRSSTNASSRAREVPPGVEKTPAAEESWGLVSVEIRNRLRRTAWEVYGVNLGLVGEKGNALYIAGPPHFAEWFRRKYASAVGAMVREVTDFDGLFVCDTPEEN